jgi:hypothetical protein
MSSDLSVTVLIGSVAGSDREVLFIINNNLWRALSLVTATRVIKFKLLYLVTVPAERKWFRILCQMLYVNVSLKVPT